MANKPFVPASRVGNLHSNLGIPQSQKIGMAKLQSAKNSPRPLVRKEATEAINMQGGKNKAPAQPKAPKSPVTRFVNKGAKMAHKEVVSHFADATIRGALNQHASIQSKAK